MTSDVPPGYGSPEDGVLLIAAEYLREALDALRDAATQFMVHQDRFQRPYRDRPEWTPWDQPNGVARTVDRCVDVAERIVTALDNFPAAPEEPAICDVCHKPSVEHTFRGFMEHWFGMSADESRDVVHRMFGGLT